METPTKTERATIFVGREGQVESYQLLIDKKYFAVDYDGSIDRELFFDVLSDGFVEKLLQENKDMALGTVNGVRINLQTYRLEKISRLEHKLIAELGHKIITKYMQIRQVTPASTLN
jgi:hypothetical protein